MSDEGSRRPSAAAASAPTPRDAPAFLPYAAAQLQAPFALRVVRQADEEYQSAIDKGPKKASVGRSRAALAGAASTAAMAADADAADSPSARGSDAGADARALRLAALHDAHGRLVALALRGARVPCQLLKLVAMCVPYQPHLTRLTLRACALDAPALHQLVALLPDSQLEQLCLDDSPPRVDGYRLLVERPTRLRRLSLDRCRLGDSGVAALAAALHHPLPAAHTLRSLSLATNGIGDEGARALAAALRSNRTLQHLNLADNRLTDAGATAIFETLSEFPLTSEESLASRRRIVSRLQLQREVFVRARGTLAAAGEERAADAGGAGARRRTRKSLALELVPGGLALDVRAELMTEELLGPFAEPFGAEETATRDGVRYCRGNGALCWLNLAHNSLGHAALRALARERPRAGTGGLLRARLDGNALPAACAELRAAAARLEAALELAQPTKKIISTKPKK